MDSSSLKRLVLKTLKAYSSKEKNEFKELYSLDGEFKEVYEIVRALDQLNRLYLSTDNIRVFIENVKAIGSEETLVEAEELLEKFTVSQTRSCYDEPLSFTKPRTPPGEMLESPLTGISTASPEVAFTRSLSEIVTGSAFREDTLVSPMAGPSTALEPLSNPNKKRRLNSETEVQECDSTCNSPETPDDQEDLPQEAQGDDLKYIIEAIEEAKKSQDPHTKVGAVLVKDGKRIGSGYNRLPREGLSWEREAEKEEDTKYPFVTHAAVTAILNAYKDKEDPRETTLYTTLYPSARDGVIIFESGVKAVVFLEQKSEWRKRYHTGATKKLFDGKIECRHVYLPGSQRV